MLAFVVFGISFIAILAIIFAAWWYECLDTLINLAMGFVGIALFAGLITCLVMAIISG